MLELDVTIKAEFMESKRCQREEKKRKEQLYAEVEFSAQGYDTHVKHSPRVNRFGCLPQDSPQLH